MHLNFDCSGCGKALSLPRELAGREGKCPTCGAILQVPHATPSPTVSQPTQEDAALERQRLALERERLEVERKRLEVESERLKVTSSESGRRIQASSGRHAARSGRRGQVSGRHRRASGGRSPVPTLLVVIAVVGAGAYAFTRGQEPDSAEPDSDRPERVAQQRSDHPVANPPQPVVADPVAPSVDPPAPPPDRGQGGEPDTPSDPEQEALRAEVVAELTRLEVDVKQGTAAELGSALTQLAQLEVQLREAPELLEQLNGLRESGVQRAGEVAQAELERAQQALTAERLVQAAEALDAIDRLARSLPVEHRDTWTPPHGLAELRADVERERAAHARETAQQEAAREAAEQAAAKRRVAEREALESKVRRRALDWLESRLTSTLHCAKCEGEGHYECPRCDGKGRETYGAGTRTCQSCDGDGEVECGRGYRGFRLKSLREAFWNSLSPAAREGKSSKQFYRDVVDGRELVGRLGTHLAFEAVKLVSVEVLDTCVRVSAEVKYPGVRRREIYASEWIRAGDEVCLRTRYDAEVPLFSEGVSGDEACSIGEISAAVDALYVRRDAEPDLVWAHACDELIQTHARVRDVGRVVNTRAVGAEIRAELRSGEVEVVVRFPTAFKDELLELAKGDSVRFVGTLVRWNRRTEGSLALEIKDAKPLE